VTFPEFLNSLWITEWSTTHF